MTWPFQKLRVIFALALAACTPISAGDTIDPPLNTCSRLACDSLDAHAKCSPFGFCAVAPSELQSNIFFTVSLPLTSFFAPASTFAIPARDLFSRRNDNCEPPDCAILPPVVDLRGYYAVTADVAAAHGIAVSASNHPVSIPVQTTFVPLVDTVPPGTDLGSPVRVTSQSWRSMRSAGVQVNSFFGKPETTQFDPSNPLSPTSPEAGISFWYHAILPAGIDYEARLDPVAPFDVLFPPVRFRLVFSSYKTRDRVSQTRPFVIGTDASAPGTDAVSRFIKFSITRSTIPFDAGWTAAMYDTITNERVSAIKKLSDRGGEITLETIELADTRQFDFTALVVSPPFGSKAIPTLVNRNVAFAQTVVVPVLPPLVKVSGPVHGESHGAISSDSAGGADGLVPIESGEIELTSVTGRLEGAPDDVEARYATYLRYSTRVPIVRGMYEVSLPPGAYNAVVIPARGGAFAQTLNELSAVAGRPVQAGKALNASRKVMLTGSCFTADGRGLAAAQVEVTAASSLLRSAGGALWGAPSSAFVIVPRSVTTTTNAAGAFAVEVDPGAYDVRVVPALGSKFPWAITRAIVATSTSNDIGECTVGLPIDHRLVIRNPYGSGVLVPGALVSAYAVSGADGTNAASTPAIELGRSYTDENGSAGLLLPLTWR